MSVLLQTNSSMTSDDAALPVSEFYLELLHMDLCLKARLGFMF